MNPALEDDEDEEDEDGTNEPVSAADTFREIAVEHLHHRWGKSFSTFRRDLTEDYGQVDERKIYRVLAWLMKHGLARRSERRVIEDDFGDPLPGLMFLYYRVGVEAVPGRRVLFPPVPRTEWVSNVCGLCGQKGVSTRSHEWAHDPNAILRWDRRQADWIGPRRQYQAPTPPRRRRRGGRPALHRRRRG